MKNGKIWENKKTCKTMKKQIEKKLCLSVCESVTGNKRPRLRRGGAAAFGGRPLPSRTARLILRGRLGPRRSPDSCEERLTGIPTEPVDTRLAGDGSVCRWCHASQRSCAPPSKCARGRGDPSKARCRCELRSRPQPVTFFFVCAERLPLRDQVRIGGPAADERCP